MVRIFSKFHDYYDIGLSYGIDPFCVYERETKETYFKKLTDDNPAWIQSLMSQEGFQSVLRQLSFSRYFDRELKTYIDFRLIFFCGKAYLTASERVSHLRPERPRNFVDIESYEEFIKEQLEGLGKKVAKSWQSTTESRVYKLFDSVAGLDPRIVEQAHIGSGSPIIQFMSDRFYRDSGHVFIVLNPCLQEIGFPKLIDAYTAFQELSMYLTNLLGIQPAPTIQVSDDIRIAKHGFNNKSFRKEGKQ